MYLQSVSGNESLQQRQTVAINKKLDALATTELLAISRPPASFPLPSAQPQPKSISQAVKEINELQRQLGEVRKELASAQRDRDANAKQLDNADVCC